jgi:magnesium transporter
VGDVRAGLEGRRFDHVDAVVVLEDERLAGVVPIEELLLAEGRRRIAEVMDGDPPVVSPDTDQEAAAWRMVHRHESSLGVVDEDGGFRGLIPADRLLAALLAEHDAEVARLGGSLPGVPLALRAAQERVGQRIWHRLPWLLVGLAGAMASALIVGAFEHEIDANVLLALFVPGVVYMADAVGTQTETVLIRALSVGVTVRSVLARELITGLVIGAIVGAAFLPFALIGWGDADIAVAVSLALFASCSIATLIAMLLPSVFQRLGRDPAFGSGPLATVIQDLLSILVYFGIVSAIVI